MNKKVTMIVGTYKILPEDREIAPEVIKERVIASLREITDEY